MHVDYCDNSNNFIITTKFYESEYVRQLPSYRWKKGSKAWAVPCVRLNVAQMREKWLDNKNIEITEKARNKISEKLESRVVKKVPFPNNFPFVMTPRNYQKRGLDFVYNMSYFTLHMAMGSGKTKTIIDLFTCHYLEGKIDTILVICPLSIRPTWVSQFTEHCPKMVDYEILAGDFKSKKFRRKADEVANQESPKLRILVVGTPSLRLETGNAYKVVENFIKNKNVAVVVDEAHDIKNIAAAQTKQIIKLTNKCQYRVAMTGTPVSQSILDLYGQFQFLHPDILGLGCFEAFRTRYAVFQTYEDDQGRTRKFVVGYQRVNELMEIIKPFTFQVTKEEAAKELPEKVKIKRYVTLSPSHMKFYADLRRNGIANIPKSDDISVKITHILSLYTSLQQVAGGFITRGTGNFNSKGIEIRETHEIVTSDKNEKIKEVKRIIDSLPKNEQIIIWVKHRKEAFMLEKELYHYDNLDFKNGCCVYLDKTDEERKQISKDMDEKNIRYFISTPNSGGVGLTMNTVSYVIYMSNSQRLLHREQSEDRNHRIGQKRTVTYTDIIADKTIDAKVLQSLEEKKDLVAYIKETLSDGDFV